MNIGAALSHKVGPLPAGVWVVAVAGALYINGHRSSSSDAPDAAEGVEGDAGLPASDASAGAGDQLADNGATFPLSPIIYLPGGGGAPTSPALPPAPVPGHHKAPGHHPANPAPVHHHKKKHHKKHPKNVGGLSLAPKWARDLYLGRTS